VNRACNHSFNRSCRILVDLGHKSAFDLLLKEAWNPEVAAMGNSTLPTVLDKLNVIYLRKLIGTLVRENGQ
jgi:transcriptional regulatory protein LevR